MSVCHPSIWEMKLEGPKSEAFPWVHGKFQDTPGFFFKRKVKKDDKIMCQRQALETRRWHARLWSRTA